MAVSSSLPGVARASLGTSLLLAVRSMGVEQMWEDHKLQRYSGIKTLALILGAQREVRYPEGAWKGKCDLVVTGSDLRRTWIEIKFAWTYDKDSQPEVPNKPFVKHLLGRGWESAERDVVGKLPTLDGLPEVQRVGFLLVAFHSLTHPLGGAIDRLEAAARMTAPLWSRFEFPDWVNPRHADCRICALYWERAAPSS